MSFSKEVIQQYTEKFPLLNQIIGLEEVVWFNPKIRSVTEVDATELSIYDMKDSEKLWQRFAPFLEKSFPEELKESKGIIESPLRQINQMREQLNDVFSSNIEGNLFVKCDNELSIAGSVKARGSFFEILHYAERLAIEAGLITKEDNYEKFTEQQFKDFFSQYSIGVGSTGNLGLGIGIMSAKLGFNVSVFMSADAKQWKKDLLREKGATVYEFDGDFSEAIKIGREKTLEQPNGYFVDDEDSEHLFLGYSTAAFRLKKQLDEQGVVVDKDHPLFVYLPCGVGGAPGGIMFGLKQVFGDHVHCFFVEPTEAPAVLIGLLTEEKDKVCVQDFGISNRTEADGLAVGRGSRFATMISEQLVSGVYTLEDKHLFEFLALLKDSENIFVEPSATAGFYGPKQISGTDYIAKQGLKADQITHIVWATGGSLVPEEERQALYRKGKDSLEK
ncbi:D-serine ammonia-lyase [Ornithinibacillus sp. 4-3]|uniref:Probable D-serine dehydratase n=1 Tax=Ornithinibacillus sp. 4-3 TaxID=3231488 RepID=A0AB39HWY9_9BACI